MDKTAFISHIAETAAMWAEEEKKFISAESGEERETAGIRAFTLYGHLEDDLHFFGQMSAQAVIQTVSAN